MTVVAQFVFYNGARIRISDANYYPFRSFPSHTKISQMFQVKWLESTVDHTIGIAHWFSLWLNGLPGQTPITLVRFSPKEFVYNV